MNIKKVGAIFNKEILDILRDRRTIFSAFVLPLILYPILFIGLSALISRQEVMLEQKTSTIYIHDEIEDKYSRIIYDTLTEQGNISVLPQVDVFDEASMLKAIEDQSLQAIVYITRENEESAYPIYRLKVTYNQVDELSQITYRRVSDIMQELEKDLISQRLLDIQVSEDILQAIDIEQDNIAPPERMVGAGVGRILPYILILMAISGGAYIASDLVVGEKERGTLETILVSAAMREELLLGKYMTVMTISFASIIVNLVSLFLSFQYVMTTMASGSAIAEVISLPFISLLNILILLIPMLMLISAVLLIVSTYSRNVKEANSYLTYIIFLGIILSMVSMIPGFSLNRGFALIPILNFSLLMRDILIGSFLWDHYIITIVANLILALLSFRLCLSLFKNENIMFRTVDSPSLSFWGKNKRNIFSANFAIMFFIVLFLALFHIGGRWQMQDFISGIIKTQLILILLPAILVLKISKTNIKKALRLRIPKPTNFVLALFLALPMMILSALLFQLIDLIFPVPSPLLEEMSKLVFISESFWINIIIIALLPGICEEILFRGYFINAFTKHGFWKAILISALLFGLFHMSPFRMIPTAFLGFWMGYMLLRTGSILIPIFAHILNNGFALTIAHYGEDIPIVSRILSGDDLSFWLAIPATIVMIIVIYLFEITNKTVKLEEEKSCVES